MSKENNLEGKGNALLVVLEDYIATVAALAVAEAMAGDAGKATKKKAGKKAAPAADEKKLLAEKKAEAKQLAGAILKEFNKDALGDLLAAVEASKFSDINTIAAFEAFIESASDRLAGGQEARADDDDLLGDDDAAAPAEEKTLDDVKDILLQVNNHKELGRDVTKQILGELGVRRLPELQADKYGEAYAAAEKALKNVG